MAFDPQQIMAFSGVRPRLGRNVHLAPGSRVVGDVRLGDRVSVWFNAVLRGDIAAVDIGDGTNIQDNCTVHVDDDAPCLVGRDVVVGHGAILHGCRVGDRCLIGMGSTVLTGARIGDGAVIAAGALVPEGRGIPAGHLAIGVGAKVVRPLPPDFWTTQTHGASRYRRLAECYRHGVAYTWPDPVWDARDAEEIAARPPRPSPVEGGAGAPIAG